MNTFAPKHQVLALWAVPRSVSTAFERMMINRGDFEVPNEPFSVCYYFSEDRGVDRFEHVAPDDEHRFEHVLETIAELAEKSAVFFKDMPYHLGPEIVSEAWAGMTNTFLIRDPALSIPSLYKRMPDFTMEEAGFEALHRLFEQESARLGYPPPVIDGEDLRANPEAIARAYCAAVDIEFRSDTLNWEPGTQENWKHWNSWYGDVAKSTGFEPPDADRHAELRDIPKVADAVAVCRPHYEALRKHCLKP